jgi:hypothetical protein
VGKAGLDLLIAVSPCGMAGTCSCWSPGGRPYRGRGRADVGGPPASGA